jgi:nucleoside-diphosphate-sugar epimerase
MDYLKEKSLLVVGGTGFIGSALLQKANKLGMKTTSLSLKKPINTNIIESTNYLITDTSNFENLQDVFADLKFNYIVNLAGYINHDLISNGGFSIVQSQINLLNNLVSLFNVKKLIRFIQIGSSDEYGLNKSPQMETSREDPISPYSLAKVMNAQYLQMLNKTENFPAVILRLFLVYGPRQKINRLIPHVIKSCIQNTDFTLSEGNQIKDFTYVEDVVDFILISLIKKNVEGNIINVGSGEAISVKNIVEMINSKIKLGNPKFSKKFNKNIENSELIPDLSKSKKLLNLSSKTSLDDGLQRTIDWYKTNLQLS